MEREEPLGTVSGNVNWYSHHGKQYGGFLKIKHKSTILLTIPLPGVYPKEGKPLHPKIAALPSSLQLT